MSTLNSSIQAPYCGRFAPSPTGPLHFGSLLAAIASFLDARAHGGQWLVRIEDLDPPREPAGAADLILRQLESFGLCWDREVLYQSARLPAYAQALQTLQAQERCYSCTCSRPQIRDMGAVYDGHCRHRSQPPTSEYALRVRTDPLVIGIDDSIVGSYSQNIASDCGDFVIRRKDGLFAYQLAVVVDDAFQGITHVIRGADLLDSTPRQIFLQRLLQLPTPVYGHIPLIVDGQGEKLSKQRFAPAIDSADALTLTHAALSALGQRVPPLKDFSDNAAQLEWAIRNWDIQAVPKLATIPQASRL
jgi:glutamyl-Q tRNA(Asp) synthetase